MRIAAERGYTTICELLADKFKASVFSRTKVQRNCLFNFYYDRVETLLNYFKGWKYFDAYCLKIWTYRYGDGIFETWSSIVYAKQGINLVFI